MPHLWNDIKKYPSQTGERRKLYYRNWYAKNGRSRSIDYVEIIREWRKNHPEAVKAHKILAAAIKIGKIKKPKNCLNCNELRRLSAHHKTYDKPLEVLWVCSSCHKLLHI